MSASALILLLVGLCFVIIILGVPVYASLGFIGMVSLIVLTITKGTALSWIVLPSSIYNGATQISLLAIPFYIFAGELMNKGGITKKLVNFALLLIGKLPASLAQANIVASMFFWWNNRLRPSGYIMYRRSAYTCNDGRGIHARRVDWRYGKLIYMRADHPSEHHDGSFWGCSWVLYWRAVYGRIHSRTDDWLRSYGLCRC